MAQTISKHIGEGFGKGELYAALAYDTTDVFGGLMVKQMRFNPTSDTQAIAIGTSTAPATYTTASETGICMQIYSNYTGDDGYYRGFYSLATYTPDTAASGAASVYGVMGQVTLAADCTYTEDTEERLIGTDGRFTNLGVLNGAGAWVAGTRGCIYGAGTWTKVAFATAVLAACQLSEEVSTGIYAAFTALSTNAPVPDTVLNIWGYFDNFLNVSTAHGTCYVSGDDEQTGTTKGLLRVQVADGEYGYINVYV